MQVWKISRRSQEFGMVGTRRKERRQEFITGAAQARTTHSKSSILSFYLSDFSEGLRLVMDLESADHFSFRESSF